MLGYLPLDIICSSNFAILLTVFLKLRSRLENCSLLGTVQKLSADKYPNIFSRQMEAIAAIYLLFM